MKPRPHAAMKTTARIQVRRGSRTAAMEAVAMEGPGWLVFLEIVGKVTAFEPPGCQEKYDATFSVLCTCLCW